MMLKNNDRVLFTGDSVTDAGRAYPIGELDGLGMGFVKEFDNLLAVKHPEVCVRVTNTGISGNTSKNLLDRFIMDVVNINADYVAICIGVNDVWSSFSCPAFSEWHISECDYESNLIKMSELLKGKVKKVFFLSPYYICSDKTDPMRIKMNKYRLICKDVALKSDAVFIDLQMLFDDYMQKRHFSTLALDHIHPNRIASLLIADYLLPYFE